MKNVSKIGDKFMKDDKDGDIGFFLKVDIEYPEELHGLHIDLPFLPKKLEVNGHTKLACTHNDKKNYVAHIRNIKQALEHGLRLKKVHKAIAFYQEVCLKS